MKLGGNTILITGGATGIGYALAERFLSEGSRVIICGRRENRLREAAEKLPGVHWTVCDVGSEADRKALYERVTAEFPELNMLINNGAYQNDYSLTEGPEALAGAGDEINVILHAPIMLNAMFTRHLRNVRDAAIVNVTSILGYMPVARIPVYCAAKAGFHAYTLVQRRQYLDAGIDIKIFEAPPPRVETELNLEGRAKAGYASGPQGLSAAEYADFVIDGISRDELDIFYGQDGRDVRLLPRFETETRRLMQG